MKKIFFIIYFFLGLFCVAEDSVAIYLALEAKSNEKGTILSQFNSSKQEKMLNSPRLQKNAIKDILCYAPMTHAKNKDAKIFINFNKKYNLECESFIKKAQIENRKIYLVINNKYVLDWQMMGYPTRCDAITSDIDNTLFKQLANWLDKIDISTKNGIIKLVK